MVHLVVNRGGSMKKTILVIALLVLSSLNALAIEREFVGPSGTGTTKSFNQPGQTNYERLGISGNTSTGNAGYITMMSCNANNDCFPFYLWFDGANGKLCTASYPTISTYTSFPTGDWRTGMPCTVVGSQS